MTFNHAHRAACVVPLLLKEKVPEGVLRQCCVYEVLWLVQANLTSTIFTVFGYPSVPSEQPSLSQNVCVLLPRPKISNHLRLYVLHCTIAVKGEYDETLRRGHRPVASLPTYVIPTLFPVHSSCAEPVSFGRPVHKRLPSVYYYSVTSNLRESSLALH